MFRYILNSIQNTRFLLIFLELIITLEEGIEIHVKWRRSSKKKIPTQLIAAIVCLAIDWPRRILIFFFSTTDLNKSQQLESILTMRQKKIFSSSELPINAINMPHDSIVRLFLVALFLYNV